MKESLHKRKYITIPTQLREEEFNKYILPHLSMPKRGPKCKIGYWKIYNYIARVDYTGEQWHMLPIEKGEDGKPEIHYTQVYRYFAKWSDDGSFEKAFIASVDLLNREGKLDLSVIHGDGTNTIAKKGGDLIGYSGHKHQTGEKIIAIIDNNGYVIAPMAAAPVNETDMTLLPSSLSQLKSIVLAIGLTLIGAIFNLDSGFDSKKNRRLIYRLKMKPNIKENPRNRKQAKPGPQRFFDDIIYKLRYKMERSFAWEDKFKRLLIRFERIHLRHLGFQFMAFTFINLRAFCPS